MRVDEIVSEPDLRSPEEAALYVKKLRWTFEMYVVVMEIWKKVI